MPWPPDGRLLIQADGQLRSSSTMLGAASNLDEASADRRSTIPKPADPLPIAAKRPAAFSGHGKVAMLPLGSSPAAAETAH